MCISFTTFLSNVSDFLFYFFWYHVISCYSFMMPRRRTKLGMVLFGFGFVGAWLCGADAPKSTTLGVVLFGFGFIGDWPSVLTKMSPWIVFFLFGPGPEISIQCFFTTSSCLLTFFVQVTFLGILTLSPPMQGLLKPTFVLGCPSSPPPSRTSTVVLCLPFPWILNRNLWISINVPTFQFEIYRFQ